MANTTTAISVDPVGAISNEGSYDPSVSDDGRFVAFVADATDLVTTADANTEDDVFLRDTLINTTTLVSHTATGDASDKGSGAAAVSGDGRYVVYDSSSTNLVPGVIP